MEENWVIKTSIGIAVIVMVGMFAIGWMLRPSDEESTVANLSESVSATGATALAAGNDWKEVPAMPGYNIPTTGMKFYKRGKDSYIAVTVDRMARFRDKKFLELQFPQNDANGDIWIIGDLWNMALQKVRVEIPGRGEIPEIYTRNWLPITPEAVNRLIYIIEHSNATSALEHKNLYLSILRRWQRGDFSHAVKDFNDVSSLSRSMIGQPWWFEATRLLTKEEEQEFITTHNSDIQQ